MCKEEIRTLARALRRQVPPEKSGAAAALLARLQTLPAWRHARRPSVYAATAGEAPTEAVLADCFARGLAVLAPRVAGRDIALHAVRSFAELAPGAFGILEPRADSPVCALEETDCVIVPGVAFDAAGGRVGRGGGYYDRFLSRVPAAPRIALAWEWQVFAQVPADARDERVDWIVTPEHVLRCETAGRGGKFCAFPETANC